MDLQEVINRYEMASFTVTKRIQSLIKEQLQDILTIEQHCILRTIKLLGRATTTELAEMFLVNKSAITAIIARLTEKGYIKRFRDRKDRRIVYLMLTEEGNNVFEWSNKKVFEIVSTYLKQFDQKEIEAFIHTFETFAQLLHEEKEEKLEE
ncbi:MarR family transcriptional regulator [Fictibacillus sp. Mic-4]|uniref:MarR family winged helix-turn-helix transcriptional regulator n=1 Tax=Fictibacillus sp. Mic-4 TaxID=3132826 RepID=UPI003CEAC5CD